MKTYLLKNSTIFSFVFLFAIIGKTQVTSNFDYDLEGWVAEGDNYYYYETGQGNPGNCLRINDYATGEVNMAIAPGKFLGDWSAATNTGSQLIVSLLKL